MPAGDMLSSGMILSETCELFKSLELVSHCVNTVLKIVDPIFHTNLMHLHTMMKQKYAIAKCMNAIDPLLLESQEVLYNRLSGLHFDRQDPKLAYAVLLMAGSFKGGHIWILLLKLRIRLEPGDMVLIQGRVLGHQIKEWEGGQRISILHFTHTSMWRSCGLEHLVDI